MLIKESRDDVINSLKDDLRNLNQKLESLTSRFTDLEASVLSIKQNQEKLESEITNVNVELSSAIVKATKLSLTEMDKRMARMNNIIIRGLPEEASGTVEERRNKDQDTVQDVLQAIDADEVDVAAVKRIGKTNKDQPRLLRISFSNLIQKQEVIHKSKFLRNSNFKNVYIQSDLTPMQQEFEYKLRLELKERRKMGEDVVIHAGAVRLRSELRDFQM